MYTLLQNKLVVLLSISCFAVAIFFLQGVITGYIYLPLIILASLVLGGAGTYLLVKHRIDRLVQLSNIDQVTGLYHASVVKQLLSYDIERAKRYKRDLSVILLDIDNFSLIIDTYGKKKSEDVLRLLSKILLEGIEYIDIRKKEFHGIRSSDIAFRLEGEDKIIIIMPETGVKGAYIAAERIREAVMFTPFQSSNTKQLLQVTLSASVVSFDQASDTTATLLERANLLLLKAKITKNHVVIENPIHKGLVPFEGEGANASAIT